MEMMSLSLEPSGLPSFTSLARSAGVTSIRLGSFERKHRFSASRYSTARASSLFVKEHPGEHQKMRRKPKVSHGEPVGRHPLLWGVEMWRDAVFFQGGGWRFGGKYSLRVDEIDPEELSYSFRYCHWRDGGEP